MLFEELKNNKGTVSSKLGKELALKVLDGDKTILQEAIELVIYDLANKSSKSIRAGAAKIVEKVAEKRPELVSPYLEKIFPGFSAPEPQTRWMLMMVYRYCGALNSEEAVKAMEYAAQFINEQCGVCLSGAVDLYLGSIGALSKESAEAAYPILLNAYDLASLNEVDWIIEAFTTMSHNLNDEQKLKVKEIAENHLNSSKKATVKRVNKLLRLL